MSRPERIEPGPGQESVWDYPRPPVVVPTDELVEVLLGGVVVARTTDALRVLETSQAPAYYLPVRDVAPGALAPSDARRTVCEWKGVARYFDVRGGDRVEPAAAWTYEDPTPAFRALVGHVALYPGRMDACRVDGEVVVANEGDFYGGWITSRVVGPFKGGPGSRGW